MDPDLLEDRLEVVLDSVRRDEEAFGHRTSVVTGYEQDDHLSLSLRERIDTAHELEGLVAACGSERDGDLAVSRSRERDRPRGLADRDAAVELDSARTASGGARESSGSADDRLLDVETYRMLGIQREEELLREARRLQAG